MRYLHRKVKMDGYTGEVISYHPHKQEYTVRFDKGHPFMMDDWDFPEGRIQSALLLCTQEELWGYSKPKRCECGAEALGRNKTNYSHALWCDLYKGGY